MFPAGVNDFYSYTWRRWANQIIIRFGRQKAASPQGRRRSDSGTPVPYLWVHPAGFQDTGLWLKRISYRFNTAQISALHCISSTATRLPYNYLHSVPPIKQGVIPPIIICSTKTNEPALISNLRSSYIPHCISIIQRVMLSGSSSGMVGVRMNVLTVVWDGGVVGCNGMLEIMSSWLWQQYLSGLAMGDRKTMVYQGGLGEYIQGTRYTKG